MHQDSATDSSRSLAETGKILVVDDNESNRDMLSRRLRHRGYVVDVAENGRHAMDKVRSGSFDLVLLDVMMPEMNGYEVLTQLKADDALRHVPVLMISAVDDLESVIRCIELGADDYLPKPFNPALLRARVEASLARKYLHDRERLYARSLEHELEIGREIQRGFLPEALPQPVGWEVAARFQPARQVAGDFYDAFEMADGRIGFIVADVCGKGVGAALFMALFRSLIRAYADPAGGTTDADVLKESIAATNAYITRLHKSAHMFASVFFGALEPATGLLRFVNAGHLPPVIAGPDGPRVRLAPTGPAVGLSARAVFHTCENEVAPGELFLAFTDGVTEARNVERAFFTEERLLSLLGSRSESAPLSPTEHMSLLLDRIEHDLAAFTGETAPSDDVTILAIARDRRTESSP